MKIFITGTSSCLAAVLLPVLCEDSQVSTVTGIDIKPTKFKHPKLTTKIIDIRDKQLTTIMKGHDAIIHCAFIVKRNNLSLKKMHAINIGGGMNVADAAATNHIHKFINLSSTSVYGSGLNFTEKSPYNPSSSFHYALHKTALEQYINKTCPEVIHLRPQMILGQHAQASLKQLLKSRLYIKFNDEMRPKQQVIHENDVVNAIMLALKKEVTGEFNLSAPEIIDITGTLIKKGRKALGVPFSIVDKLIRLEEKIKSKIEFNIRELLLNNTTVDCSKAKELLGWQAQYGAWDARNDTINAGNI